MGGSGSSGYRGYGASTSSSAFGGQSNVGASQIEMEINEFLELLLKEYNSRDVDAIQKHLSEIEKALGKDIEEIDRILFGGSVSKSTYIEGVSDVDALVVLDMDLSNLSPDNVQSKFFELLSKRFPNTEIAKGNLAVTLKFTDYEIQLLPAIRQNGLLYLPSGKSSEWSAPINSKAFTNLLTQVNKVNNNQVVPVIKLAKGLLGNLPDKYRLSGYHIEALAIDAFNSYNGKYTLYDMTKHLLTYAESRVLSPTFDRTGQSNTIDDDFGPANSISRQYLSKHI